MNGKCIIGLLLLVSTLANLTSEGGNSLANGIPSEVF